MPLYVLRRLRKPFRHGRKAPLMLNKMQIAAASTHLCALYASTLLTRPVNPSALTSTSQRQRCVRASSSSCTVVSSPRRGYTTGNAGFTLGDLAKAFQQMHSTTTPTTTTSTTTSGSRSSSSKEESETTSAMHMSTPLFSAGSSADENVLDTSHAPNPSGRSRGTFLQTQDGSSKVSGGVEGRRDANHERRTARGGGAGDTGASHVRASSRSRVAAGGAGSTRSPSPSLSLLNLSDAYAERLTALNDVQLCFEMESQLGRRHFGSMLQCLYEVAVHRVPQYVGNNRRHEPQRADATKRGAQAVHPTLLMKLANTTSPGVDNAHESPTSAKESASKADAAASHRDRILTAVLRTLIVVDVYALDPEMEAWRQNSSFSVHDHDVFTSDYGTLHRVDESDFTATTPHGRNVMHHVPFTYVLSQRLRQWLSVAVCRMNAHLSLQVLHYMAQQTLWWDEAVLSTLVDSIIVHISRGLDSSSNRNGENDEQKCSSSADDPFSLDQFSLLLDTMTRVQGQVYNARRLQFLNTGAEEEAVDSSGSILRREVSNSSTNSTNSTTMKSVHTGSRHPIFNEHLFRVVAEALTRQLRVTAHKSERPHATSSCSLAHSSTATFFFLTRALSRLQWWDAHLMAALAPQLTAYLLRHPEAYLGVAMVAGRQENSSGDVVLLHVLQCSLLKLLRQRQGVTKDTTSARGVDVTLTEPASPAAGAEKYDQAEESDGFDLFEQTEKEKRENAINNDSESADGGGQHTDTTIVTDTQASNSQPTPSTSLFAATTNALLRGRGSDTLALVDAHIFPELVESLTRFYTRTLQTTSTQPVRLHIPALVSDGSRRGKSVVITHATLTRQMRQLFALLQADAQRGIASVDDIVGTLSPVLLARTLTTLLHATHEINSTLPASDAAHIATSKETDEKEERGKPRRTCDEGGGEVGDGGVVSPLVVELTYAWTQYIAQQRPPPLPPRDGRASRTAADVALYHRVAASVRWRRAVRLHTELVKNGLLQRTRKDSPAMAAVVPPSPSSSAAGGTSTTGQPVYTSHRSNVRYPSDTIQPGRFFVPDALLETAPRVQAAVQKSKTKLQADRTRRLHQLTRDAAAAEQRRALKPSHAQSSRSRGGEQYGARQTHAKPPPKFASASIRAAARSAAAVNAEQAEGDEDEEYRAAAIAALRRPLRSSDVFAKYSKALSRLL